MGHWNIVAGLPIVMPLFVGTAPFMSDGSGKLANSIFSYTMIRIEHLHLQIVSFQPHLFSHPLWIMMRTRNSRLWKHPHISSASANKLEHHQDEIDE